MKTEIALRKRAVGLHLQGWKKSEIARKVQRSRRWVERWISRYEPDARTTSLQDHSRAPKHIPWAYPERIKRMVTQIRVAGERGKRVKYQYALVSAQAIYYEMPNTRRRGGSGSADLGNHPIPPTRFCRARR